jgi:putative transposase
MREDNLLAVQPRTFVVTTASAHDLEVFLNLARRMKMTGINQLWVADITYIRLQREFDSRQVHQPSLANGRASAR